MARMTSTQIASGNNMNVASQRVGLFTRIDALEYGNVVTPAAGTVAPLAPVKYTTNPAIGTATYVHAAIAQTASTQTVTTAITNPDFPRLVSAKGNASGNAGDVVITGTDINGAVITDTIALSGASEVAGVKAFKTVTSIALPAEVHAGTDTVSIGVTNKIGYPVAIPNASLVLAKSFDLLVDAGTTTVGTTAATSVYAPAGTLNGVKLLELTFLA